MVPYINTCGEDYRFTIISTMNLTVLTCLYTQKRYPLKSKAQTK